MSKTKQAPNSEIAWYNEIYTRKPNKWASEARNELCRRTVQAALKHDPASVLDIGCGIGHTISYLRAWWPETAFTGMDMSDVAIDTCKARMPWAEFVCGELGIVPLGKHQCVISLGVFEHIEDTAQALADTKKCLTAKGVVYVEIPNCIAYPEEDHAEGFRRINVGNHQIEWHRFRPTWEALFTAAGFTFEAFTGPTIQTEFVWILRKA